jgi:hypothetical protein
MGSNENNIWQRLIRPDEATLSKEAARSLLAVAFSEKDRTRMNDLAERNQRGELNRNETRELNAFIQVGEVLGLIHSKARQSLNNNQVPS